MQRRTVKVNRAKVLISIIIAISLILLLGCKNQQHVDVEALEYYESGNVKGEVLSWDENGSKMEELLYYYESGNLERKALAIDEILVGQMEDYYESGNLKRITPFVDGKINGQFKEYHENGNIKVKGEFVDGLSNGPAFSYYETGEKKAESFFKNDFKDSICTAYFQNGNIESIEYYENDTVNGKSYFYHSDGALKAILLYQKGYSESFIDLGKEGDIINFNCVKSFLNESDIQLIDETYPGWRDKVEEYLKEKGDGHTPCVEGI